MGGDPALVARRMILTVEKTAIYYMLHSVSAGSCERRNKTSSFVKSKQFLD
jgi:hypothetical protein